MLKKFCLAFLSSTIAFSSLFGISTSIASATSDQVVVNQTKHVMVAAPQNISKGDSTYTRQQQSIPSYVGKEALQWAIKNTTRITNLVGAALGKKAAVKFGNIVNNYIKPLLKQLEKLDACTYGKLEKELYDVMVVQKLDKGLAREIASAIVEIIRVFGP